VIQLETGEMQGWTITDESERGELSTPTHCPVCFVHLGVFHSPPLLFQPHRWQSIIQFSVL